MQKQIGPVVLIATIWIITFLCTLSWIVPTSPVNTFFSQIKISDCFLTPYFSGSPKGRNQMVNNRKVIVDLLHFGEYQKISKMNIGNYYRLGLSQMIFFFNNFSKTLLQAQPVLFRISSKYTLSTLALAKAAAVVLVPHLLQSVTVRPVLVQPVFAQSISSNSIGLG